MLSIAALCFSCIVGAQTAEMFKPYKATDLRLPSVPLVVNDPYFSIWSPYDKLTEGTTRHWTNDEKPLTGLLRVDGQTYCFMGGTPLALKALLPTARETAWKAPFSRKFQEGWEKLGFDDSSWETGTGAFGSENNGFNRTNFAGDNTDVYVRRTCELTQEQLGEDLYLLYSHDDVFEVFINGVKILDTGETWKSDQRLRLDEKARGALRVGRNVIAVHCHNTFGGAEMDYGLYANQLSGKLTYAEAVQKSVSVMATSTYYTFSCGPVELDLVFTAPMLMDDYDLLSVPVNYISYQVRSTDKKEHDVQFYLDATQQMAVNKASQPTVSSVVEDNGTTYLKTGTIEQPILAKKGDGICIDWGYFYLPAVNGEVSLGNYVDMQRNFLTKGNLLPTEKRMVSRTTLPVSLAYLHNFGKVSSSPKSSFMMVGYDEILDIEYMFHRYKAYWAHEGKVTIFNAFDNLKRSYTSIMNRCRNLDKQIYDDGLKSGNKQYAEILSGSYRHVIAAHKLFRDNEGNLLFFSKENNSNGSVNTVDLTYPSSPLFLIYNPELLKGMMTSILDYSLSGRWTEPFAAHDVGTYPIANGQTYGGYMPLEEAGNILILTAMVCQLEKSADYAAKYWEVLTVWANYLAENGQDPANQLCTDDFAGHWAHNVNLSAKAILGVMAYSRLAAQRGEQEVASRYEEKARKMAAKWEQDALDGDHYRLAFDRPGTWSQKYNLIWDKLWKTHLFSDKVMEMEVKYYLGKQNTYGLPLDCRRDYTKSDWIMWSAAMAKDKATFLKFVAPLYKYVDETVSRVPLSDWYDSKTTRFQAFIARSVIGGHWMKVLADKLEEQP